MKLPILSPETRYAFVTEITDYIDGGPLSDRLKAVLGDYLLALTEQANDSLNLLYAFRHIDERPAAGRKIAGHLLNHLTERWKNEQSH